MKRICFFILAFVIAGWAKAQTISFQFQDESIDNRKFEEIMETRITALLTEINLAEKEERNLNLQPQWFSDRAYSSLMQLWNNMHFYCEDEENVQPCINDQVGFQVRGIPVTLKPMDDSFKGSVCKELTISFGADYEITGVRMSLDTQSISQILKQGATVTDTRRRREILKFVEDFRSYYNEKNIKALEQVFSDDALIITGKVVMSKKNNDFGGSSAKVVYSQKSKKEYLKSLQAVFAMNKFIEVGFDEISVVSHPAKEGFYGVTLRQSWNTSRYSDEGYLFLLWDFTQEMPQIHVRTWQPTMVGSKPLDKNDIFTLDDFEIP